MSKSAKSSDGATRRAFQRTGAALLLSGGMVFGLTACTPGESIAYHVVGTDVDVAFCDNFSATSVTFDFGKYPPPFMGGLYSIAVRELAGEQRDVGGGVPISQSIDGWERSGLWDEVPTDWERVDIYFSDGEDEWVGGTPLFRRDVVSDEWAWTTGMNMASPRCSLAVDPQ